MFMRLHMYMQHVAYIYIYYLLVHASVYVLCGGGIPCRLYEDTVSNMLYIPVYVNSISRTQVILVSVELWILTCPK